ncbi:MAG: hypothetical protein QOI98_23 [Solirubrobacteraceae bacterium]|nr:hypothetical protein [Solirubrobacteraceae bacterium]
MAPAPPIVATLDADSQADARAAVSALAGDVPHIGGTMAAHLHERIPELGALADEHALLGHTEASCTSNIAQIVALLGSGSPAEELVVPEPALEYAQGLVQRRIPLAVLLRAYHLGHGHFWNIASGTLKQEIEDDAVLASSLEASSNFMFEYIDGVCDQLVSAYHVERDRWVRTAAAVRAEIVRHIVDGHLDHERSTSTRLGYELRRHHVGLILAGEPENRPADGIGSLEREAIEAAAILGCGDPLLVPAGAAVLWAWCGTFKPPSRDALSKVEKHRPSEGVRMAIGGPGYGIEGFRITHMEAGHAARFWALEGAYAGGGTTSYRSVEVVSLLASDLDRARRFVLTELGPLAEQSDAAASMRVTLLGFLAQGCSHVHAAQQLHMHQNTVYNRVRRVEELLGGSVAERRVELQTALMLAETLGAEVLN